MRKLLCLLIVVLLFASFAAPALARGGAHHGGGARGTRYPVCTVEGCTLTGPHVHDGNIYCTPSYYWYNCPNICRRYK